MFVILTIFLYLSGVSMQLHYIGCREYDFNDTNSILSFESCSEGTDFIMKSYADVCFEPFRNNVGHHLSNVEGAVVSCFRTKQIFNMNNYTEIISMMYLKSTVVNDNSDVRLVAIDSADDNVYFLGNLIGGNDWNEYHIRGNFPTKSVKFEIRAFLTADAVLGIEYFYVKNLSKAEPNCRILSITTQTTPTTTAPTTSFQTETQPSTAQMETTTVHTETTTIHTETTNAHTEATNAHTETTSTMEQTTNTETRPSTPCVDGVPSNVFNIYNFISFFNFTSKIIN